MSVREESFLLIDETEPSLRENKSHLELDSVDGTYLYSELDIVAPLKIEAANLNSTFGTKFTEIRTHSIFHEPETGIVNLSFSTNESADGYPFGKEFTSELSFLTSETTANPENNLGLACSVGSAEPCLDFRSTSLFEFDEPIGDLFSFETQGFIVNESINEPGSLASCNRCDFIDTSLGYPDEKSEFLFSDESLENISFGTKLTEEVSFLSTSENSFLNVGMDSNYELGACNQAGIINIQAEDKFNLIDTNLGIGIDAYKPSGQLNDGIVRTANNFEIEGEMGFLTTNDNANLYNDAGLIPKIENSVYGLEVSGDLGKYRDLLIINESNNDSLLLDGSGASIHESIYETGSLASFSEGVLSDQSLGYAEGGIEFLTSDASLGDMFRGTRLSDNASFLDTSENTFLDVGINSDHDFEMANHEEEFLKKAVHEALEEFGKSYKIKDSEINIESFTKTFRSNSLYSYNHTINMAVVNLIIVEGDAKYNNVNVYTTENSSV